MIDFQFSSAEISRLHNAKCELHGLHQQLDGVVADKISQRLQRAIDEINASMKRMYDEEHRITDEAFSRQNEIAEANDFKTIWSVDNRLNFDEPHSWPTAQSLRSGDRAVSIGGPTWLDLWKAADSLVRLNGYQNHIFVEGFNQESDWSLQLSLGS